MKIAEQKDVKKLKLVERIMRTNETQRLGVMKRIIRTNKSEKSKIVEKVESYNKLNLRLENIIGVKEGGSFEEPNDKVLPYLSNDKTFTDFLEKSCKENYLQIDDIKRCLGGLYHTASKYLHRHENIIIDQQS
ncbi:18199_t:CDS:2, partial [Racocetra persica]